MNKNWQRRFNNLNRLADAVLLFAALQLANYLWLILYRQETTNIASQFITNLPVAVLYALLIVLGYQIGGLYETDRVRRPGTDVFRVCLANLIGVLAAAAVLFVFRLEDFSRAVLGLIFLFSCVFILIRRAVSARYLSAARKKGLNRHRVFIVGDGALAAETSASFRENPERGYAVEGYIGKENAINGVPCLGGTDALAALLEENPPDELIAAPDADSCSILPEIIAAADNAGVKLSIVPFFSSSIPSVSSIESVGSTRFISVRATPLEDPFNAGVKRLSDIILASVFIVLSSPLMLIAAVGTKLSSPGPIIFRQERVGLNRRLFYMYKFRSMRVNASEKTGWTTDDDPRKTKFGSFLRKTSIDELPQFFNVLKGDMSIVGPRPEVPHYVEQFRKTIPLYMVKHRVRPGITGWAQIKGYRGDTSIAERIRCDIWYIENWSLSLDVRILFLTVFGGMINKEQLK